MVRDNSSQFQSWGHTTPKQQCHFISDSKVPIRYEDNLCFQNRELINHCKVVMGGGKCVTHMFWQMKPTVFLCVPKWYHSSSETNVLISWNRGASGWSFKHRTNLSSQQWGTVMPEKSFCRLTCLWFSVQTTSVNTCHEHGHRSAPKTFTRFVEGIPWSPYGHWWQEHSRALLCHSKLLHHI